MNEPTRSWLVRMTYRAPDPNTTDGRLVEHVKQLTCDSHAGAHGAARRWTGAELPAGAVDSIIEIEHRTNGALKRVEPWPPSPPAEPASSIAAARLALVR